MITGSVTAKPQAFAAAVKWAAKFIDARPSVPIQGGLQLTVEGGRLSVLAFNESLTARALVPIEGTGDGQVVVSGRLLDALAATFPNRPVVIRGHGEQAIAIEVGAWKGTLPIMTAGDFPAPPLAPPMIGRVRGDDLATAIRQAGVAASSNEKQAAMFHCMHLTFGDGLFTATSTDRYRAARARAPFEGDGGGSAVVYAAPMIAVAEGFAGPDDVHVGLSDGAFGLASATRAVIMRQSGEEYAVLDALRERFAVEQPEHAVVVASDLQAPLKRAELVRQKDGPIRVTFSGAGITLAAAADELMQDSAEAIEAKYSGADWTLRFNPRYLSQALASAPGDTVDIALSTEKTMGVVITVPGNDQWRHLLMPIR